MLCLIAEFNDCCIYGRRDSGETECLKWYCGRGDNFVTRAKTLKIG